MRVAQDRRVLVAAALHGALVLALASLQAAGPVAAIVLAVLLAWGANTVAHIHLHTPIFRGRAANRVLSLYLSALLGFPQALWRHRHLRHHASARPHGADRVPPPARGLMLLEIVTIVGALGLGLALVPAFVLGAWLPGIAGGLALCALQGRMEHMRGEALGISHYGRLHNTLWFNDGFHVEHHRWPGLHWSALPARRLPDAPTSRRAPWTRVLTNAAPAALDHLERMVLGAGWLQRLVVRAHVRATARLLGRSGYTGRVRIVGGGLFPRSVHVVRALAPHAPIEVVDASAEHIAVARATIGDDAITWRVGVWAPSDDDRDVALTIVPLAYRAEGGEVAAVMRPGPSARLVHTWIWKRSVHPSAVVAWWLLKRAVLVPAA